jgi:hypothetical protein
VIRDIQDGFHELIAIASIFGSYHASINKSIFEFRVSGKELISYKRGVLKISIHCNMERHIRRQLREMDRLEKGHLESNSGYRM